MKVGNLVRHRLEGRWDEIGVVIKYVPFTTGVPGGMVEVLWNVERSHRNDWLYRTNHLEVLNENR
jgi:hypothetical protein